MFEDGPGRRNEAENAPWSAVTATKRKLRGGFKRLAEETDFLRFIHHVCNVKILNKINSVAKSRAELLGQIINQSIKTS